MFTLHISYCRAVTKTRTGLNHMDRIYAIHFTDHGQCFSKNLPFHGPGNLVSSPDAHLITGTVPCLKPKKLRRRISNPKYESLIINCISLHVGLIFRVMDLTPRSFGLGRVQYLCLTLSILFNKNIQDATRQSDTRLRTNLVVSSLVRITWSIWSGPFRVLVTAYCC